MEQPIKAKHMNKLRNRYNSMDPEKKDRELTKKREAVHQARSVDISLQNDLDHCLSVFRDKIKEGPCYVCSVCQRMLYRRSVVQLKKCKYDIQYVFTDVQ
jgi:hypothetical protein